MFFFYQAEELMEIQYSLRSACCAALMELVLNDANGQYIIQANGIYSLGLLILPPCKECVGKERKWAKNLQVFNYAGLGQKLMDI